MRAASARSADTSAAHPGLLAPAVHCARAAMRPMGCAPCGPACSQVNETPGTYWWHGHAGVERVDGFYGPLIVRPNGTEALAYDEERMLLISDNFHGQANAMTFGLNRCAPATQCRFCAS